MIKNGRISMLPDRQNTVENKEVTGCGIEAEILHVIFVWGLRKLRQKQLILRLCGEQQLPSESKLLYPSISYH